jgi:hypothetical protein
VNVHAPTKLEDEPEPEDEPVNVPAHAPEHGEQGPWPSSARVAVGVLGLVLGLGLVLVAL